MPGAGRPPQATAGPVTPQAPSSPSLAPNATPQTPDTTPQPAAAPPTNGAPVFVPHADTRPAPVNGAPVGPHAGGHVMQGGDRNGQNGQCTAPQLRRFIKSRPYVPMHELRRRFGIDGGDDDVTGVRLELGWVYVGLPTREGGLLGDLLKAGEIGYELSLDPRTPIVIGVYPMRPIPRS
jgi:hypothetical protein